MSKQNTNPAPNSVNPILLAVYRYKFLIILFLFGIWLTFFDSNNLMSLFQLKREIAKQENKKEFYQFEINRLDKAYNELVTNENIADYARRKEWVKRENEEIYKLVPQVRTKTTVSH